MGQHLATFSGPQQGRPPANDRSKSTTPSRPPYRGRWYCRRLAAQRPEASIDTLLLLQSEPCIIVQSKHCCPVQHLRHPYLEADHGTPSTMAWPPPSPASGGGTCLRFGTIPSPDCEHADGTKSCACQRNRPIRRCANGGHQAIDVVQRPAGSALYNLPKLGTAKASATIGTSKSTLTLSRTSRGKAVETSKRCIEANLDPSPPFFECARQYVSCSAMEWLRH